jgi:hypothetical protein
MPVRRLPSNPNLDHLKYQAKDLLKDHAAHDPGAAQRIREFHPRFRRSTDAEIFDADLKLSDAQLAIARESGFPSWARLKRHIERPTLTDQINLPHHERIEDTVFRHAVDLIDAGDVVGLRAWLKQHPLLSRQHITFEGWNYFHNPTLLEFVAENPVRHGTMPDNIVEVAKVILDAGVEQSALDDTLALVATGSIPQQCGKQLPLIDLLCGHGVDPNGVLAATALHGGLEALDRLIKHGARVTLPVAAALGRITEVRQMLPGANSGERHLAFALASQYGQVEIVRLLLDEGEDPNRYNPVGGHSHCTPLHQAAGYGPIALARLLVERGARLDIKDILWHGTPTDWAHHQGNTEIEAYLRAQEAGQEERVN